MVQRISYYLRKPQEEKWKYDITCATSCEVDDLLTNCDDAEAELWKGSTSKNRFERKSSMILIGARKVQRLIEEDLDRASKRRTREGCKLRYTQREKW